MSNASRKQTGLYSDLDKIRAIIEIAQPDLRDYMSPPYSAKVLKVYDDDTDPDTYYRADVSIAGAGKNGDDLEIPKVKVDAAWAESGYGMFALPEIDSEVSVVFDAFDKTRPHITGSRYQDGKAPKGFKAGTFAIRGKNGQKIELKAEANEVVITGNSLKVITASKRQDVTGEDYSHTAKGNHSIIVTNTSVHQARIYRDTVLKDVTRNYGSLDQNIDGDAIYSVGGKFVRSIAGSYRNTVAGDQSETAIGNFRRLVTGNIDIMAGGGGTGTYAYTIQTPAKGILINTLPGAGFIELGQGAYQTSPAVCLAPLITAIKALIAALQTPLQIGNFGAPTAPNPAFIALLQTIQQAFGNDPLTSPLGSKLVWIRQV